jgi:hypothetical protein
MRPLLLAAMLVFPAATALAQTRYHVYCASGRIEVDSRDPDQMRIARGSSFCQFAVFDFRSDAENLARRQFGGVGASCTCR